MMEDPGRLGVLLRDLVSHPAETEWIEFKENNEDPREMGEYYSLRGGPSWMEGARGWEGRVSTGMPTRSGCCATFSPRFLLDSRRVKLRIGADDADYILETFPIVKRHDEQEFGEYRTKRVILERYGEYARKMGVQNGE
jgi:hypothetical protein